MKRSEAPLLVERVDLDDEAVDLVVELDPLRLPEAADLGHRFDRLVPLREGVRAEAMLAQPLERLPVRVELDSLGGSEAVHPDRERPGGGDRRVLLAQEPAAAFLGFGASFWPSLATRVFSSLKPEIGR